MKHTIWTNDINVEDWRADYINACEIDEPETVEDGQIYEWAYDLNISYLDDERANLDSIFIDRPVIVFASLGLWDNRRSAHKVIASGNLGDCLYSECDYCTWYCDDEDFRFTGAHHDGNNYYTYRLLKEGVDLDEFEELLYEQGNTVELVNEYTESLRPYIAKVYGW